MERLLTLLQAPREIRLIEPASKGDGVVGELKGQRRQDWHPPMLRGGIQLGQVASENSQRLRVRSDMVRRTLLSDLDTGMERPETRVFTSDPVATVLADRSRYVSACLLIVRAYLVAGQPGKLSPIASFAEWSGLVRSALVWLGCADPAESMKAAREDDPELGELREVIDAWKEAFGSSAVTVRTAIDTAITSVSKADHNGDIPTYGATMALPYPALKDALTRVAGARGLIEVINMGFHWPVGGDESHVRIVGEVFQSAGRHMIMTGLDEIELVL